MKTLTHVDMSKIPVKVEISFEIEVHTKVY